MQRDPSHPLVLVVDDDPTILDAMRWLLEGWGCDVLAAASGEGARSALSQLARVPDAVIADYDLRNGETGPRVLGEIRVSAGFEVPAVVISGETRPDLEDEMRSLGLALVRKPVAPPLLKHLLDRILPEGLPRAPAAGAV